ncbi:MAG: hypothetical protein J5661_00785 [Bacteroidaceae bacterium]|nr:hypothetical protein [Bacteroidaceae bacterium]
MAFNIQDFITKQVASAVGTVDVPSAAKNQVLNGLTESILGSLTQTATKAGGIEQLKNLLTGTTSAAASPITALAANMFSKNILGSLGLNAVTNSALTSLVPGIVGQLGGILKDQDGDGDVDLNDILATLGVGGSSAAGSIIGSAAKSILGSFFGKKK